MPPALQILFPNGQVLAVTVYIDDPILGLIPWTGSGGGGGGGAVTIADGADVAEGAKADVAWDGMAANATVISILKKIAIGSSSSVTIVDGADTVEGHLADAADIVGVAGTINAKLRGLVQLLATLLADAEDPLGGLKVNVQEAITGNTLHIDSSGFITTVFPVAQPVKIDQTTPGTTNKVTVGSDVVHVIVDSGVTSGLTDAQLRATPVPVSGTLTGTMTGSMEVKGLVNVNAPTYSDGDIKDFSITTDGRLRVSTSPATDGGGSAWNGFDNVFVPNPVTFSADAWSGN